MKSLVSSFLVVGGLCLVLASCSVTRKLPSSYSILPQEYNRFAGTVEQVIYPTSVAGTSERRMYVYLPEGYRDSELRYPTLYMFHGASGDETDWIIKANILPAIDSLVSAGKMAPSIVVFTNMNSYDSDKDYSFSRHKSGVEAFFEVDGAVETSFINDVVKVVDSKFRTMKEKNSRAIAGLSIGGMQAIYISASSPETFGNVGIFSAPLHSVIKKGKYSSFYDDIETKLDSQFVNPPLLYEIYVGTKDVYRKTMEKFCKEITSRGFPCTLNITEGGHQWNAWRGFAIDFLAKLPF